MICPVKAAGECDKTGNKCGHAVKPDLTGIDWVIAGSESGPNRRHVPIEYFKALKNQCVSVGIPFFFKQFSIANIVQKMPELDGKIWNQTPKIN